MMVGFSSYNGYIIIMVHKNEVKKPGEVEI